MNKITQSKKLIINLGEEQEISKKNIKNLENHIADNQKDVESIKSSDDYQEFLEITKLISNYTELETKAEQLADTMNKIAESKKLIINLGKEKEIDKKNIKNLENQIVGNQKDIESIKNSDNYKQFVEINKKLDSMSDI